MRADEWVLQLLFGGFLVLLGQGIRVVTGLTKLNDQAATKNVRFSQLFAPRQLMISLLIRFIGGATALVSMNPSELGSAIGRGTHVLRFIRIAALLLVTPGCALTAGPIKSSAPLRNLNLVGSSPDALVEVVDIIQPGDGTSWTDRASWTEVVVRMRNTSTQDISIGSATLVDSRGVVVPQSMNPMTFASFSRIRKNRLLILVSVRVRLPCA